MDKKNSIVISFVIFMFLLCAQLPAQIVFTPLENNVYDFLQRLNIKGLTGKTFIDMKPLPRHEILRYLLKAKNNAKYDNLSGIDKGKLKYYLKQYLPEKIFYKEDNKLARFLDDVAELVNPGESKSQDRADSTFFPFRLPIQFYSDNSYLQLAPIFRCEYDYNTSDSSYYDKNSSRISIGARTFGYLGDHLGFNLRIVNNKVDANKMDFERIDENSQGVGSLVTRGTFYDEVDAYLSASTQYVDLILGKFSNYWGAGKTGSISISNRAPSYPQIMLRTGFSDWLKFVYFHGWLESNELDDSLSYTIHDGNTTFYRKFYKSKYVAAHRLEIAPWNNFKFAFSEMLYYGETDPKLIYFIPVMFFWSAQHQTNDQDNEEICFDIGWSPSDVFNLYGSLVVDDIRLTKIFDKNKALNYIGYQIGSELIEPFISGLDFQIEYTHINPWVYTHKFAVNRATSDGYLMGYWSGQNSDNLFLELKYDLGINESISINFSHYRKGAQDSIYKQYECPPSEKFLFGHQYTRNSLEMGYEKLLFPNTTANIGFQYRYFNVNKGNITKAEQGIYVNPVYYKNDFSRYAISLSLNYNF